MEIERECIQMAEDPEEVAVEPLVVAAAEWPGVEAVCGPAGQHKPIVCRMMAFE